MIRPSAFLALCLCFGALWPMAYAAPQAATTAATQWYWLTSDDKYSKYFEPASVKVTKSVNAAQGQVATEIEAWTKTTYSYAGAKETIDNYEIKNLIPNPATLAYSLAEVQINPQNRTIQYLKENFYDANGKIIWSKTNGRIKEINSQEFDEDFYAAIVDAVFQQGETERRKASDRWIDLWDIKAPDGSLTRLTADTTTMRRKGDNLFLWEWQESKDAKGKIVEVKFMKKSVNLAAGTEKIISGRYWSPNKGWQALDDDMDGSYRAIGENSPEFKGLSRLRAFANGYSSWVNRYSID